MSTVIFDFLSFKGTKWFVAVDWPRPQRRSNWQTAGIGNPLQHFVFPASEAFPQISSFSCLCSTLIWPVIIYQLYYPNHPAPLTNDPKHYDQYNHFLPGRLAKPNPPAHRTTLIPLISLNTLTEASTWPRKYICENGMEQQYAKVIQYNQLFQTTLSNICTHKNPKNKMQNFEHVCLEPKWAKFKKKKNDQIGLERSAS